LEEDLGYSKYGYKSKETDNRRNGYNFGKSPNRFFTVTTTFMDAFSAGVSAESISGRLKAKRIAVIVAVIGTIGAVLYPMDNITGFLYLIGSVFAPMIAIQITDYFLLKKDSSASGVNAVNLAIWLAGFITYRMLMHVDTILGNTLPDMLITVGICLVVNKAFLNPVKRV
jgi:purine-cytosine permease-like protein